MTDALAELIADLRARARAHAVVGDNTPSTLLTRAADALVSLNAAVDRAAWAERLRIASRIRDIGPDFDSDDFAGELEAPR